MSVSQSVNAILTVECIGPYIACMKKEMSVELNVPGKSEHVMLKKSMK